MDLKRENSRYMSAAAHARGSLLCFSEAALSRTDCDMKSSLLSPSLSVRAIIDNGPKKKKKKKNSYRRKYTTIARRPRNDKRTDIASPSSSWRRQKNWIEQISASAVAPLSYEIRQRDRARARERASLRRKVKAFVKDAVKPTVGAGMPGISSPVKLHYFHLFLYEKHIRVI